MAKRSQATKTLAAVERLVRRGFDRIDQKDLDGASADFEEALLLKGDHAEAYVGRAAVFYEREQFTQAIAELDIALRLDPRDDGAYSWRGNAYFFLGDYDRA